MNCKETPAMFACKSANAQELADLFGDGWDMVEGVLKDENFKCNVVISSARFLQILESTIYFKYLF